MKVLTITLHSSDNVGSSLQAFALQRFLLENNIDSQIIDYRPEYVATNGKKIKTFLKKIIYYRSYKKMNEKNSVFVKNFLRLTPKRFFSYRDLEKENFDADVFITGSDQLWNSDFHCGRDKAFYLGFVKKGKKIAYGVSLGKEDVSPGEVEWICSNIKDFDFISVREESSKKLLLDKGIPKVSYVCDPVLLLNKETFSDMLIKPSFERYVAVYLVNASPLLEELLGVLRERYGLKIVLVGAFRNKCTNDIHIRGTSPSEFIGLMANAEFIVASSYHATLFSHLFEKKFAILPPEKNAARIEQFLTITGLERHLVRDKSDLAGAIENIDYKEVKRRLDPFIEVSKKFLLDSLK